MLIYVTGGFGIVFLDRYHNWLTVLLAAVLFAFVGVSAVVWGVFVRLVLVYQFTWLVHSAAPTPQMMKRLRIE